MHILSNDKSIKHQYTYFNIIILMFVVVFPKSLQLSEVYLCKLNDNYFCKNEKFAK